MSLKLEMQSENKQDRFEIKRLSDVTDSIIDISVWWPPASNSDTENILNSCKPHALSAHIRRGFNKSEVKAYLSLSSKAQQKLVRWSLPSCRDGTKCENRFHDHHSIPFALPKANRVRSTRYLHRKRSSAESDNKSLARRHTEQSSFLIDRL